MRNRDEIQDVLCCAQLHYFLKLVEPVRMARLCVYVPVPVLACSFSTDVVGVVLNALWSAPRREYKCGPPMCVKLEVGLIYAPHPYVHNLRSEGMMDRMVKIPWGGRTVIAFALAVAVYLYIATLLLVKPLCALT